MPHSHNYFFDIRFFFRKEFHLNDASPKSKIDHSIGQPFSITHLGLVRSLYLHLQFVCELENSQGIHSKSDLGADIMGMNQNGHENLESGATLSC